MINLHREDGEAVDGPRGALGVDGGVGQGLHTGIFVAEPCVDSLHHVGAVLIGGIDAALEGHGLHRLEVFHVPLHHIYPAFAVKDLVEATLGIVVRTRGVDIVGNMVVGSSAIEYLIAILCETHNGMRIFKVLG